MSILEVVMSIKISHVEHRRAVLVFKSSLTHAGFYAVLTLCSSSSKNDKVLLKLKSIEIWAPVYMNGKSFSPP